MDTISGKWIHLTGEEGFFGGLHLDIWGPANSPRGGRPHLQTVDLSDHPELINQLEELAVDYLEVRGIIPKEEIAAPQQATKAEVYCKRCKRGFTHIKNPDGICLLCRDEEAKERLSKEKEEPKCPKA